MSLASLTSVHSVTIERASYTASSSMGKAVASWSTSNRGSLDTTLSCRVVPANSEERDDWSTRNIQVTHKVYSTTDPEVTDKDRLVLNGRYLYVKGVKTPDEMGLSSNPRLTHYMVFVEETKNGARS